MRRRDLLKYAGATALAAPFVRAARADQTTVKIGVVGPKTGPLAPGAAVTHFPPWRLWAHQVNEKGGLKLKDGQRKVELIEYDDRTQPPEAIQRLNAVINQALQEAPLVARFRELGGAARISTPAETLAFIRAEQVEFGVIARAGNIRVE